MAQDSYDILAIGAHPDDVEVGCGGVIIDQTVRGKRVAIAVLTRGEMGTGGTPEGRAAELADAATIMGATVEATFDWGDTQLTDSSEHRLELAELIRRVRPKIVLTPYPQVGHGRAQSHPDHVAAGVLTINAALLASLKKSPLVGQPHQPRRIYHYFLPQGVPPTFIVDITPHFERYIEALKAHRSQFLNSEKERDYIELLTTRSKAYGLQAGCLYGQGFAAIDPVVVTDISHIASRWDWK